MYNVAIVMQLSEAWYHGHIICIIKKYQDTCTYSEFCWNYNVKYSYVFTWIISYANDNEKIIKYYYDGTITLYWNIDTKQTNILSALFVWCLMSYFSTFHSEREILENLYYRYVNDYLCHMLLIAFDESTVHWHSHSFGGANFVLATLLEFYCLDVWISYDWWLDFMTSRSWHHQSNAAMKYQWSHRKHSSLF